MAQDIIGFLSAGGTPQSVTAAAPLPTTSTAQPASLGAKTSAQSLPVVLATDQATIGVDLLRSSQSSGVVMVPTSVAAGSLVIKGSAGLLYGVNLTAGASAGYLMLFNSTSAPADGTVTPVKVWAVAANQSLNFSWVVPLRFTTGITAVFSTTGPFTKTISATAFISGDAT